MPDWLAMSAGRSSLLLRFVLSAVLLVLVMKHL